MIQIELEVTSSSRKNATYQPLQEIKEHFGERVRLIEKEKFYCTISLR